MNPYSIIFLFPRYNGCPIGTTLSFRLKLEVVVKIALFRSKMSLNGVLVTPIEQNRSLLNSVFKFKPSSKLYCFVTSKGGVNKTLFTLAEVKDNSLKCILFTNSFCFIRF